MLTIRLPAANGRSADYRLRAEPVPAPASFRPTARSVFAAAHVVADPHSAAEPSCTSEIAWEATLAFRRHLADLGLGIAEAMDTAQRGNGLDWPGALELVRRTRAELPDAPIVSGAGTDQLPAADARTLDQVRRAYHEQLDAIQPCGGRLVIMASRALATVARDAEDYAAVYRDVLAHCERPVILHWLGEAFDPALAGYWGSADLNAATQSCLAIIHANAERVDGIKLSLLDPQREIALRRQLPAGVKLYSGDDFNYPTLIAGDEAGYSHALLGVFDPLATVAAAALARLEHGDSDGFRALLEPTVPLARLLFRAPTPHYKTGVVFLAWLNGFQDHFVMLAGAQAQRPLPYFVDAFKLADRCGALLDPELACARMRRLLALYGVDG